MMTLAHSLIATYKGPRIESWAYGSAAFSPLTIAKPTNVQSGDLLVAVVGNASGNSMSGPTGWTQRANDIFLRVATLIAGGSEPACYSFTSGGTGLGGIILCLKNAAFDTIGAVNDNAGSGPGVAPTITSSGGILLSAFLNAGSSISLSTPTDMAVAASDADGSQPSFGIFNQIVNAGSTGSRSTNPSAPGWRTVGVNIGFKAV